MRLRKLGLALAVVALAAPAVANGNGQSATVEQGAAGKGGKAKGGPIPFTSSATKPSGNEAPAPAGWYIDGMAAIRAQDPAKAVALMKPVLADFEKRYGGEKRHIYCAINPAQTTAYKDDAAKANEDYITIEPDWCRAQYVRAYALIDLEDLDGALIALQQLTGLAPRNSRYLSELGYVLSAKRRYAEALATYQRSLAAVAMSPDDAKTEKCAAYRGIGFNQARLGHIAEAETAYRACLAIDPDNQEVKDAIEGLSDATKETV